MSHQFKLTYFPLRGRGEHLRYILYQSGRPFEDDRVNPQDWPAKKPSMPFGALPVLTVDGKTQIAQQLVIGQFLAAELGMAGRDHVEAARVFMLAHGVCDNQEAFVAKKYNEYIMPFFGKLDFKKADELYKSEIKDEIFAPFCERYTKFLQENGGTWLVGERVSWADLFLAEWVDRVVKCCDANALDKYPVISEHCKRVHELPNIKKYVATRPKMFEKDW